MKKFIFLNLIFLLIISNNTHALGTNAEKQINKRLLNSEQELSPSETKNAHILKRSMLGESYPIMLKRMSPGFSKKNLPKEFNAVKKKRLKLSETYPR